MTGAPRAAAAISAGFAPALVALLAMLVIESDRTAALVTALIVWVALSAVMWARFGRPR